MNKRAAGATEPAKSKRKKRTRLDPEERKQYLLDAAADVVLEQGVNGLTMESVAERADVSRALAYFYFESRTDLIRELYGREFGRLYDAMLPALEGAGTLEERLRGTVHAYFEVVRHRHDLYAILNAALDGPEYRRDRRLRYRWWEEYVGELVGGQLHVEPSVARVLAVVLLDINARCALMWHRDRLDREEIENLCVQLQVGGIREAFGIDPTQRYG